MWFEIRSFIFVSLLKCWTSSLRPVWFDRRRWRELCATCIECGLDGTAAYQPFSNETHNIAFITLRNIIKFFLFAFFSLFGRCCCVHFVFVRSILSSAFALSFFSFTCSFIFNAYSSDSGSDIWADRNNKKNPRNQPIQCIALYTRGVCIVIDSDWDWSECAGQREYRCGKRRWEMTAMLPLYEDFASASICEWRARVWVSATGFSIFLLLLPILPSFRFAYFCFCP